jgi:hypothetical protein
MESLADSKGWNNGRILDPRHSRRVARLGALAAAYGRLFDYSSPKVQTMGNKFWHWPDHAIGKRESRRLREEHNAMANEHAELLAACKAAVVGFDCVCAGGMACLHCLLNDAIAKAEGGGA